MSEPALTRAQDEVAECMAQGWAYRRIAEYLGIAESTVRSHVLNISAHLPNEDDINPYQLVFLWAAHRRWLKMHKPNKDSAA